MELYIYMEYVLADGTLISGYYDGIKDYEAQKRYCKRNRYKITEAYICAYKKNPGNPFEWGERIADTKDVDCN